MGLTTLRNPLAFPGGRPFFNPGHFALNGAPAFSAVALGGTFLQLSPTSIPGTITSTLTGSIDGTLGPVTLPNSTGNCTFTNGMFVGVTGLTFAFIGRWQTSLGLAVSVGSSTALGCPGTNNLYIYAGGTYATSGSLSGIAAAGDPVFCIASIQKNNGTSPVLFGLLNLRTGASSISTTTGTGGSLVFGQQANVYVSNYAIGNAAFQAKLATAAVINNYVNAGMVAEWFGAPWDFWYPPTARRIISASLRGSIPVVNDVSFALSDATDTAAFTLQDSDNFDFALSDAIDTASFTLQSSNNFNFALSDATDTAAFNLNAPIDFSFALNDATDTAAFALRLTSDFSFSLSDAVDTAAFSLSGGSGNTLSFALSDAIDLAAFSLGPIAPPVIGAGNIADYVFQYENFAKAYADPVVRPYFRRGVLISLNALVFKLGLELPLSALPLPGYWFVLSLNGPVNTALFQDPNLMFLINRTGQSWNNLTPIYRSPQFSNVKQLQILASPSMIYVQ